MDNEKIKITLVPGDITKFEVDLMVNAANSSLLGGGGVDGAIHRVGGEEILKECMEIRSRQGGCPVGEAVITTAGNLPAKAVIHTVGPQWNSSTLGQAKELENCYLNSLKLAESHHFSTISFPNISTGVYGYPKLEAAQIAIKAVRSFDNHSLKEVLFVIYDQENLAIYEKLLN